VRPPEKLTIDTPEQVALEFPLAGAGSRFLLDSFLQKHGIAAKAVRGYERIAYGHIPAAWHVYSGEADCCIAVRAAAQVFGLGFIPLLSERYDLILPEAYLDLEAVQIMLDVMNRVGAIDAVAAASDMIALGAMTALKESGKRVPEDVAVIGYDDTAGEIGLTSVRQEWTRAGKTLASKVLQIVNGKKAASEQLPVQLMVRASSRG